MAAPADEANLRDLLARVHERLNGAASVDPETRRLLVALTRDIERALGAGAASTGGARRSPQHQESLSSLEGFAARFDVDHPALALTLRELADLLGKVGI